MVDAAQVQYRSEFISAFEQRDFRLRGTVTTESVIKGNQATFLVAGAGSTTAVTRGVDGLIPTNPDTLTQPTATLVEWHDLRKKSGFNIFASQGDLRRVMQMNSLAVMNRKMDQDILDALDTTTVTTGASAQASLDLVVHAATILGNNEVDTTDGNITFVISPAFLGYLQQVKEFSSADYSGVNPMSGIKNNFTWMGYNFIVNSKLSGAGGASEKCFAYHKDAIGHAVDTGGVDTEIGYNGEQQYSFARTSMFMGAKVLQGSGIVEILHDGSNYAAA